MERPIKAAMSRGEDTMTRYRMDDGTVIETDNATQSWEEASDHDGSDLISRATGSQWAHETIYRSRKGRYYVEHTSNYRERRPHVEWVSPEEAARWLLHQGHDLPEGLARLESEVME